MYRKYVLGKITIFSGIIYLFQTKKLSAKIVKKLNFKIPDVCNLPIFHKLEPTQKNKCHILFREGLFYWKTFSGIFL